MSARLHLGPLGLPRLVAQAAEQEAPPRPAADTAAILDFFDVPTGDSFDVPPQKAVDFFKAKGLQPTFHYADMLGQEHARAFTVAKMMDVDMLAQVRNSLDSALANGQSFKDWAATITPILQSGGWWGRTDLLDPLTGQPLTAQLGSPWRLETIFRTNMQSAYAAGSWQEIQAQAEVAPYLMYDAVDDFRTRPLHASWDRTVLPVTHLWWATHYPPNGYNCRCSVIQIDADQIKSLGLTLAAQAPQDGSYEWTNPRTGATTTVPNGIDPGFDTNVGKVYQENVQRLLAEKIDTLPADMQPPATAAAKALPALDDATLAAIKAEDDAASIAARRNAKALKQRTTEASAQDGAMQQLDAIKAGKESAGKGAAYKIKALKQLQQDAAWQTAKPTQQIEQVLKLADEFKFKTELASKLSVYKAAVLEGKIPPPATVKAFQGLSQDEKDAFLGKIEAEVQAAKAAKHAAEKAAADAAAKAAAAPARAPAATGEPPNPDALTKIGPQKGSNPGGTYRDTSTGKTWYIKQPAAGYEVAANEVLAGKLYRLAGIDVPEMHVVMIDGVPSIASQIVDGLTSGQAAALAGASGTAEGFAADAWLANWDVVGLGYDNLLLKGSQAFRVDTGGALRFRAQGGLKGAAWGDIVTEFDSLRDKAMNSQAASVFGRLTERQVEDSAVRVLKISEADIRTAVASAGPKDLTEREALVQRLLARQADIATKYPAAARRAREEMGLAAVEPTASIARVTEAEQRLVAESRVNGYGFTTDSDQIEDNMVVVHNFRREDGQDMTRGFLKLTPDAGAKLAEAAKLASNTGAHGEVNIVDATSKILAAVKNINLRAYNKKALDATTVMRITDAINAGNKALVELNSVMNGLPKVPADMKKTYKVLDEWVNTLASHAGPAAAGKVVPMIKAKFPSDSIPDTLAYAKKTTALAEGAIKWRRIEGTYQYNTARFDRSRSVETTKVAEVTGTNLRYEAELADGTRVIYFPHDSKNAWAMQGVMQIDAPGADAASAARVFSTLDEAGINGARADETARQRLYLNSLANIRLLRNPEAMARFNRPPRTILQQLSVLEDVTGINIRQSAAWKTVSGVREAFGHGRAYQYRPDLTPAALEALNKTHVMFHNPQGLGADAGEGVFDRLKMVIDGGGTFASLTDRVRRGVPLSGSSVSSDLSSGGGDYHFTRIRARETQKGTGVYWRTNVLRRMDAISYGSDQFGRTTAGHIEANRHGQTIESFKTIANAASNETIFKSGLSLFENLDKIVLSNAAEVKDAIAWMQQRGYQAWPDGRPLAEVIVRKGA